MLENKSLFNYVSKVKKLVSILAISALMIVAGKKINKKADVVLKQISYIYYPLYFWKDTAEMRALIDSSSKINTMTLAYAAK